MAYEARMATAREVRAALARARTADDAVALLSQLHAACSHAKPGVSVYEEMRDDIVRVMRAVGVLEEIGTLLYLVANIDFPPIALMAAGVSPLIYFMIMHGLSATTDASPTQFLLEVCDATLEFGHRIYAQLICASAHQADARLSYAPRAAVILRRYPAQRDDEAIRIVRTDFCRALIDQAVDAASTESAPCLLLEMLCAEKRSARNRQFPRRYRLDIDETTTGEKYPGRVHLHLIMFFCLRGYCYNNFPTFSLAQRSIVASLLLHPRFISTIPLRSSYPRTVFSSSYYISLCDDVVELDALQRDGDSVIHDGILVAVAHIISVEFRDDANGPTVALEFFGDYNIGCSGTYPASNDMMPFSSHRRGSPQSSLQVATPGPALAAVYASMRAASAIFWIRHGTWQPPLVAALLPLGLPGFSTAAAAAQHAFLALTSAAYGTTMAHTDDVLRLRLQQRADTAFAMRDTALQRQLYEVRPREAVLRRMRDEAQTLWDALDASHQRTHANRGDRQCTRAFNTWISDTTLGRGTVEFLRAPTLDNWLTRAQGTGDPWTDRYGWAAEQVWKVESFRPLLESLALQWRTHLRTECITAIRASIQRLYADDKLATRMLREKLDLAWVTQTRSQHAMSKVDWLHANRLDDVAAAAAR